CERTPNPYDIRLHSLRVVILTRYLKGFIELGAMALYNQNYYRIYLYNPEEDEEPILPEELTKLD
ncbi:hypothetical protein N7530_009385, partial [Penicillium desertorum]